MPQPRIAMRQMPSTPNQAMPATTIIGPTALGQFAQGHENADPLADLLTGDLGNHGRRRRVEGRDADPGHEEQHRQRGIGRRQAQAADVVVTPGARITK